MISSKSLTIIIWILLGLATTKVSASVSLGTNIEYIPPAKSLGIGYTSPTEKLQVNGNILASGAIQGATLNIKGKTTTDIFGDGGESGGANRSLGNLDDYKLSLITNGSAALIIDDNGNVGIGDTTPDYLLDVGGTFGVNGAVSLGSTLAVTGATTLASTLAAGNTTITGTLSTTGAATLDSLAVGGGYGSSGVSVSSAGAMQADGAAVLASTLAVTGATTMSGALTLSGSAANINLGTTNYLSGDGDDEGIHVSGSIVGIGGAALSGTSLTINGTTAAVSFKEGVAPTATANYGKFYVKSSDSNLYYLSSAGAETALSTSNGGIITTSINELLDAISTSTNLYMGYSAAGTNASRSNTLGIGYEACKGTASSGGGNSVAIGYRSLYSNTSSATSDIAIGKESLYSVSGGDYNIGIGYQASYTTTSTNANTAVGYQAAYNNSATTGNTTAGREALYSNAGAHYNTAFGYKAAYSNNISSTTAAGAYALYNGDTSDSVAIGNGAGMKSASGYNIYIGYQAGDNVTSGSYNLIIGYDIDAPSATGSNQLSIGNLLFGTGLDGTGTTLSTGKVGIGTSSPGSKLHITGNDDDVLYLSDGANCEALPTSGGLTWSCSSDIRLKSNIHEAPSALEYLNKFSIKEFTFDPTQTEALGIIAQEVQTLYPELVSEDDEGYYRVSPPNQWQIIKAIQELENKNKKKLEDLGVTRE